MTQPYYNISYGNGFEGLINYVNVGANGLFVYAFTVFIWFASIMVGLKSEWKPASVGVVAFFLATFMLMIFRSFTQVNDLAIIIAIFGTGICAVWAMLTPRS